ncbi:sensor histidine kinase [Dactylosporangium sp. AC04546]|uniref:sensor histidine kinase n=1 Tax=Dactylosporangium sp. AC04546 TaxID=2862460 RepID=UPI001EDC9CCB|nr:sensor histidine kinase [Dactylosporangium sp. AC04546]WVK78168.1 sensor histidine kinase [Dactylosporangium sp. AC04546]
MSAGPGELPAVRRSRRSPAVVAIVIVVLGVVGVAVRLDAADDGTILPLGWSALRPDAVVVVVPDPGGTTLRTGDLVTSIGGHRLADGLGTLQRPEPGAAIPYDVTRDGSAPAPVVRVERPAIRPLADQAWGNLAFVLALAVLAAALYVRRPEEPSTGPLLVLGAGLLGSTAVVVAGLPALALATGGPVFWLFQLNTIGVYSVAWGGLLAFSLTFIGGHPWGGRRAVRIAYAGPLAVMLAWTAIAGLLAPNQLRWLALVHSGQTAVAAAALLVSVVSGVVAYRAVTDPLMRSRLRWLGGGGAAAALVSILGWHLPQLVTGDQLLPWGDLGLAGLPFVAAIGVALRRQYLFDIERLANRSLAYAATVAVLVAGYAIVVALLVSGLHLSDTVAAALAAAAAAVTLAPLRTAAQRAVDRLMYGDRHDPAGALDRLGARLGSAMLPADVLPAVVQTVASSLRVPYAAIDLADGAGGFQLAAEYGAPTEPVHVEPLHYQRQSVGRLRVSARGRDDPLDAADVALLGSLARQAGLAVQAVRLHDDLVRSRADVVASREDERRRLRRDLHDGLGPTLAAIGLKAELAARDVPAGSAAHALLAEISAEATASVTDVRRLVEALRPPALDELGLVGAVRSRAAALAGAVAIEVRGEDDGSASASLPAAVETAAYRIAVEAMTNVVRHSGATSCTVLIARRPDSVEVTVADDGRGLDPARPDGVGLRSIRERAAEVGGEWSIGSTAGGGTLVHAHLPLPPGGRTR